MNIKARQPATTVVLDLPYATAKEAQEALGGVSLMTLYRWRHQGMPCYVIKQFPKLVLYDLDQCIKWLETNKIKTTGH